jgi:hypothetical protein
VRGNPAAPTVNIVGQEIRVCQPTKGRNKLYNGLDLGKGESVKGANERRWEITPIWGDLQIGRLTG